MAVLLELEEAKEALALLRAKADQWHRALERVSTLLSRMKRDCLHGEATVAEARAAVMAERTALSSAVDLNAVLELDQSLEAATARLKKALAAKISLFATNA